MNNSAAKLRIMLVDDDEVVRMGLRAFIAAEEDLEVVAEASNGKQAIELARAHSPNVVLMDVRMPEGGGVDACREIRNSDPAMGVIMLTSYADDEALFNSIMAGAAGYLIKGVPARDLVQSIHDVGAGRALLDPAVTQKVLERIRHPNLDEKDPKLSKLSATEERVLDLVAEGLTNRQIAERIKLSDKTIKNYVSSILQKLQVARRSEAASYITRIHGEQNRHNEG